MLEIPPHFDVQGAKLSSVTQAIAYRGIRESDKPAPRRTTNRNTERIRVDLRHCNGELETDGAIWESLRRQPVRPKIQDFLYKSIHGTHKIGRYWLNIESCEDRCKCTTCNEEESLDHILTECPANTRTTICTAARTIWPYEEELWPPITPGTILGCGLLEVKIKNLAADQNQNEHANETVLISGATRLTKILISEAAYLIWALRCGRVISNRTYNMEAVETAWRRALNKRLSEDVNTATKIVRREEYTKLISNTWAEAFWKRHGDLAEDWIKQQPHFYS